MPLSRRNPMAAPMKEIATIENGPTTSLIDIVFPGDTNHHGTLFGGTGLALMDRVAFIAATRFGRAPFVTASCERIDFRQPARIGHIVEFTARPVKAGRRSLTVEVEMMAETIAGRQRHTIEIGEIVEAEARVERVGRSSMSIETKLWSENLLTGERHITATGHFTMVAVDKDHRPVPVRDIAPADVVPFEHGKA